jgi:hypothetical protein
VDNGRRGLSVTLRPLSRFQKHKRDKIVLLDGGNSRAVSLVTLVAPSEDKSPCKFLAGFSLFLSVTSVTSVTTEENKAVVVSRLCAADTSKRDRRDKLGGGPCHGASHKSMKACPGTIISAERRHRNARTDCEGSTALAFFATKLSEAGRLARARQSEKSAVPRGSDRSRQTHQLDRRFDSVFPCDPPRAKGRDRKGGGCCDARNASESSERALRRDHTNGLNRPRASRTAGCREPRGRTMIPKGDKHDY